MQKLLAIVGPTASGKTALAISLAKRLNGEILSCDSMQIYQGMDIGTAKPTLEEREGVPHHLIDLVPPTAPFSCADYAVEARKLADAVLARGKLPIFCGGTGLYLDSVIEDRPYDALPFDPAVRARVEQMSDAQLGEALLSADPASFAAIHQNNRKRRVRALEIYLLTGQPKSALDAASRLRPSRYAATVLGLRFADRAALYARIDLRVEQMFAQGLVEEVERLQLQRDSTAAQAIGYKELLDCFSGEKTLAQAKEEIKRRTRNYAKRQMTWFARTKGIRWLELCGTETKEEITERALCLLSDQAEEER